MRCTPLLHSVFAGTVMMVVGIATAPAVLEAMGTPEDILEPSIAYLRIYYLGMIGNLVYNIGAGILRAVGDSKRPLFFLIASCITNILLNILFVVGFDMGVAGSAWSTIISQALSAVLVILALIRTKDMHRLTIRDIRLDRRMLMRIIRIGFPAGLQSIMYSSSNVIIQASINSLGTDTVAAWTAYSKIDSLFWMIVSAFGISITTFVGQNYGAGKAERMRKGVRICMAMTFAAAFLISFVLYFWGIYCYRLFTTDEAVIRIGVDMMRYLVPAYFTYVAIEILAGALRGVGDCWIPMIICCIGICSLRMAWIMLAVPIHKDIYTIMFSYPLTWVVTTFLFIIYYLFFGKIKRKKTKV